jgi:pimeloyl-ACP methyl ester carboxylesterase
MKLDGTTDGYHGPDRLVLKALLLTLAIFATPLSRADVAFQTGHAIAHDGTNIYYEVHGTGKKFVLFGYNLRPRSPQLQAYVDGLGRDYKLIVAEYPSEPRLYTLTPATVARDYLEIADQAGAQEFAFIGYSWGAICGLQLAIRTERVTALIAGGFPMINGPYPQLLESLQKRVFQNAMAPTGKNQSWPEARQYLTYFEALQTFDDRSVQNQLRMPRLNFVGTEDRLQFSGNVEVEFSTVFAEHKDEIEKAGWDVLSIRGRNHFTAMEPAFIVPILYTWLEEHWKN